VNIQTFWTTMYAYLHH